MEGLNDHTELSYEDFEMVMKESICLFKYLPKALPWGAQVTMHIARYPSLEIAKGYSSHSPSFRRSALRELNSLSTLAFHSSI